ncbi:MAG: hypothetical protein RIQ94_1444 [Pseudomonadota bacterium]
MDILSILLGYPVSIFANVSTNYLHDKFSKTAPEQLLKFFYDSFIDGITSYKTKNKSEENIQNMLLTAIKSDSTRLKNILDKLDYNELTLVELRSDEFKENFVKYLCEEYNIDFLNKNATVLNIVNNGFKTYEMDFFSKATKTKSDVVVTSTLNKLYNNVAKKDDIENLREMLIKHISASNNNDNEFYDWFCEEISTVESNDISKSISFRMKQLDKIVSKLTEDQVRVLQHQKYHKRLLIKGCAGSGKTIIATERAIRLSRIGYKVLVTCFNPYLSEHIRSLTAGEQVDVMSFSQLIMKLSGEEAVLEEWNIYTEPTESEIDKAFDSILDNNLYYDAILVDEGQDFKDHWWGVIEALLEKSNEKILYIFADDKQNFTKTHAKYPINDSPFYLSKNVRNAGKIFELIKQFHAAAPPSSAFLEGLGITKIGELNKAQITKNIIEAINEASTYIELKDLAILSLSHEIDMAIKTQMSGQNYYLSNAIEQKLNSQLSEISWGFLGKQLDFKISFPLESWHKSKISTLLTNCEKKLPSNYLEQNSSFYWQKNMIPVSENISRMEYNLYERSKTGGKWGKKDSSKVVTNYINLYSYFNSPSWWEKLDTLPMHLLVAAVNIKPRPATWLRQAEESC